MTTELKFAVNLAKKAGKMAMKEINGVSVVKEKKTSVISPRMLILI